VETFDLKQLRPVFSGPTGDILVKYLKYKKHRVFENMCNAPVEQLPELRAKAALLNEILDYKDKFNA